MKNYFEFLDSPTDAKQKDNFVIEVPMNIKSKDELLDSFALAGQFPNYFGGNWDALADCLEDFHWITQQQIVIVHKDIPLHGNLENSKIYLQILADAVADWQSYSLRDSSSNEPKHTQAHQLRVIFPVSVRGAVSEFMKARIDSTS